MIDRCISMIDSVTDDQIRRLSIEAANAGDMAQVWLCELALGEHDDETIAANFGPPPAHWQPEQWTRESARAECASVILNAQALETEDTQEFSVR